MFDRCNLFRIYYTHCVNYMLTVHPHVSTHFLQLQLVHGLKMKDFEFVTSECLFLLLDITNTSCLSAVSWLRVESVEGRVSSL